MLRIGIITGSTRPNRKSIDVARWVLKNAASRGDATYELVDIADYDLPLFDGETSPSYARPTNPNAERFAAAIASYDGFVFVTPEYNHSMSGALKNAIDFVFTEWQHKAAVFVGYGGTGGIRAVEALRIVVGNLLIADVAGHLALTLREDFESFERFAPRPKQSATLAEALDQLIAWSGALRTVRTG